MTQKLIFVPEKLHLLTHLSFQAIENVLIVARTWKDNHSPTHVITPLFLFLEAIENILILEMNLEKQSRANALFQPSIS
jgi:hypothetical protein